MTPGTPEDLKLFALPLTTQATFLKAVFLLAESEGLLSTLHYGGDLVADCRDVNGTFLPNATSRLIPSVNVRANENQVGIPIENQVCVVAGED